MVNALSNVSEIATEKQNIADTKSPILTIQPKDGTGLILQGMVQKGSEPGFPLYGSFIGQDGNPIALDSTLMMRYTAPGDDDPTTVTFPLNNLRPYQTLSVSQQQDAEKIDAVKHVIKGTDQALDNGEMPQIGVGHLDKLDLVLDSPDIIDWDHPETKVYFDRNAVRTVN